MHFWTGNVSAKQSAITGVEFETDPRPHVQVSAATYTHTHKLAQNIVKFPSKCINVTESQFPPAAVTLIVKQPRMLHMKTAGPRDLDRAGQLSHGGRAVRATGFAQHSTGLVAHSHSLKLIMIKVGGWTLALPVWVFRSDGFLTQAHPCPSVHTLPPWILRFGDGIILAWCSVLPGLRPCSNCWNISG